MVYRWSDWTGFPGKYNIDRSWFEPEGCKYTRHYAYCQSYPISKDGMIGIVTSIYVRIGQWYTRGNLVLESQFEERLWGILKSPIVLIVSVILKITGYSIGIHLQPYISLKRFFEVLISWVTFNDIAVIRKNYYWRANIMLGFWNMYQTNIKVYHRKSEYRLRIFDNIRITKIG